ncbi:MAG: hypothetical protein AMJ43_08145 [Coxiella sp. DG_40]|nr:MAG: hypothetical protein AMJ43_08145 [Coxiella sp. DG_40]
MRDSPYNPYALRDLQKNNEGVSGPLTGKKKLNLWEYIQRRLNTRTELIVEHLDYELSFISPPIGPYNYITTGKYIEQKGLCKPTAAETISLFYKAYQTGEREFKEVREILKNKGPFLWDFLPYFLPSPLPFLTLIFPSYKGYCWLWMFNGNLYVPKGKSGYSNGVFIEDDPAVIRKKIPMAQSELIEKLESGDESVRFVPFGFKMGELTAPEVAKHPYIIALAGEEGAEKLAEIVEKYFKEFYLAIPRNFDTEIVRVCALRAGGRKVYLCSDCFGLPHFGYVFGIDKMTGQEQ